MAERTFPAGGLDALPPQQMARRAEAVGVSKAELGLANTFALAVLAGGFIAMGAVFSTVVATGGADLPFGLARLLAGIAFSLGLILVVVAGAELFTGNNLIVMAWAGRRVSTARLLRNWAIVYGGNLVGALATALLVFASRQYRFAGGEVGRTAVAIAEAKASLGFGQAVALGILCNALVCIAVWMSYSARSTADRILAVVLPIAAFVAAGFEHAIANMYFLPFGLLVESDAAMPDGEALTVGASIVDNLLPVTIGNLVGGTVLVGALYWFVYLRPSSRGA